MLLRIQFTLPTKRADGSDLPIEEISSIRFYVSTDNGQNFAQAGSAAPGQQVFEFDAQDFGTYLFKAETFDTQTPKRDSDDSNIIAFTIETPPKAAPLPPVLVAIVKA